MRRGWRSSPSPCFTSPFSRPWATLVGGEGERRSNFTRCHPWQDGGGRQPPLMRNIRQLATRCYYFPARRERQDTRGLKLKLIDKFARGFMIRRSNARRKWNCFRIIRDWIILSGTIVHSHYSLSLSCECAFFASREADWTNNDLVKILSNNYVKLIIRFYYIYFHEYFLAFY